MVTIKTTEEIKDIKLEVFPKLISKNEKRKWALVEDIIKELKDEHNSREDIIKLLER